MIYLHDVIPSAVADECRAASRDAFALAADPNNRFDENPALSRAWMAVGIEFDRMAKSLDDALTRIFG